MNIYIYSDESGVFDNKHNKFYVFGGILFLDKNDRDIAARKYIHAERSVREREHIPAYEEVKASILKNKSKASLYRSLNNIEKFGIIVNQSLLMDSIFYDKKTKQRYLDWAYKMAVKNKLYSLIKQNMIKADEVKNLFFYIDEHSTATNGIYELKESLEQEFKIGTHNYNYSSFYPPIFPCLNSVTVNYYNSVKVPLVRASDIVANKLFMCAYSASFFPIPEENKLYITYHPTKAMQTNNN